MRLRNIPGAKAAITGSSYVVQNPEEWKGKWKQCFTKEQPLHIEVGMGKGRFLMDMASLHPEINYIGVEMGSEKLKHRPVIVGSGPAGLFAALVLAQRGFNPIMLERGLDVDNRTNDINDFWNNRKFKNNSNVQFGEGGAGTFSDGKLTTRIKDIR